MTRVGVVGGGITGLALTHYLVENGADPVTIEAAAQPGGVIRSTHVDGLVLEHGPQRARLVEPLTSLVSTLDLEGELVMGDTDLPLYIYRDGSLRLVPTSIKRFLGTDLLSIRGKLRVLAEPLTRRSREDETVAELFSRKFGTEAYRNVIAPLVGGLYGSNPASMPARYALKPIFDLERRNGSLLRAAIRRSTDGNESAPITFEDGLHRLTLALSDRHQGRIRLDRTVTGIEPLDSGFSLTTDVGSHAVDEVVLTTPAGQAAELLSELAPDAAERLSELRYNPLALVHLRTDVDRRGLGFQVHHDEACRLLGVSWNGGTFDRDGLMTAFYGGMWDPDIVEQPPEEIGAIAAEEVGSILEIDPEVLNVTRLPRAMPAYDDSWSALDDLSLPAGLHLATNYTARVGITGRLREAQSLAARLV